MKGEEEYGLGHVVYVKGTASSKNWWPIKNKGEQNGQKYFGKSHGLTPAAQEAAEYIDAPDGTILLVRCCGPGNGIGIFTVNRSGIEVDRLEIV